MLHHHRVPPLLLVVAGGLLVLAAVALEALLHPASTATGWPYAARLASHAAALGALFVGSWCAAVGWSRRTAAGAPASPGQQVGTDLALRPGAVGDHQ